MQPGMNRQTISTFERGRTLIEAGDVEGALMLWIGVRDSLSAAGAEDPRIGTAFIEAVAEHGLERFAEISTAMFYWGFSGSVPADEEARDEILAEGRRTFTLVDSTVVEFWARTGQEDPAALSLAVKRFWIERDPTPTTPLNERLVEHWQRIAHARRNFVYNTSSPYRTDDRGSFYVKYGEPDRITAGHLGANESERRLRGIPMDVMMRFDRQPQYEIWRYATLHPGDFTYFLFGNTDGTGPFQHVEGLHRVIPSSSRTSTGARHNGIRFQYYLELFYYEDLARMGGPFGDRFAELDRRWGQARLPGEGTLEAVSRRNIDDDTWAARQPRPAAVSEFDDSPKSALSAQAARILEDGEPRILVLGVSSPLWMPRTEEGSVGDSVVLAGYEARHTVIARDRRLNEMARAGMLPVDGQGHISTLVLRHAAGIGHLTVTAEHEIEAEGRDDGIGVLPGHAHFSVGGPLLEGNAEMEVSDLIVGISPQPGLELGDLPVPLLPATRFWKNDPLRVYFEIYHPSAVSPGDTGDFDVRVRIVPFAGAVIPGGRTEGRASVTLSLESSAPTGTHFFDLDLRNEPSGVLQIVVEVTDQATGATRVRATPIRLLEN